MNPLAADLIARAEAQAEAAKVMIDSDDFALDKRKQLQFVVSKLTANAMHVLAEVLAYKAGTEALSNANTFRQQITEKMDALRTAANSDDADEWNRLVRSYAAGSDEGSDPE